MAQANEDMLHWAIQNSDPEKLRDLAAKYKEQNLTIADVVGEVRLSAGCETAQKSVAKPRVLGRPVGQPGNPQRRCFGSLLHEGGRFTVTSGNSHCWNLV